MSLTYSDLKNEVKRRATRDQGGSQFDIAIENVINSSLFRVGRESPWRVMRRSADFDTVTTYNTGSGSDTFTNDSKSITLGGATLLTDNVEVGRRIKLSGDSTVHRIDTITGETTLTLEKAYGGATTSSGTYSILGQEQYNLPIQAGHRVFLWHEEWGYPFLVTYITEQDFIRSGAFNSTESIPTHYRMWGEDMIEAQTKEGSVMTVSSSDSSDTNISITVFGTVSNFPDFEIIVTNGSNGTTTKAGLKTFTNVERVVKGASTTGRITVTANSANTTVATLPVGDTTSGILYKKVLLYPLPNSVFPIKCNYYKDPYRLVNDDDVHEFGQEFDEVIILLSVSKIKAESDQDESARYFSMYRDELKSLKKLNVDKMDWFPTLERPRLSSRDSLVHPHLSFRQVGANFGPRR